MQITNNEKQILQKHYADKVKSLSSGLKDLIQQDRQDVLTKYACDIHENTERICQIQREYLDDIKMNSEDVNGRA